MVTFKATDFKATKKQIEFIESRIRINLDCVQERFIKETRLAKREHINGVNFISLNDIIFKPKSCGPKSCGPKSCGPKSCGPKSCGPKT